MRRTAWAVLAVGWLSAVVPAWTAETPDSQAPKAKQSEPADARRPRVVDNKLLGGSGQGLTAGKYDLMLVFDRAMEPSTVKLEQILLDSQIRTSGKPRWENDRTWIVPVVLEAETTYRVGLEKDQAAPFVSADGRRPVMPFDWEFTTKAEPAPKEPGEPEEPERPPVLIVAADNSGDYTSIRTALEFARPGSQILVRPGVYHDQLPVTKAVEVIGTGPRDQIVVDCRESDCVLMKTERATIKGLTLRCSADKRLQFYAVDVPQGTLVLEDCHVTSRSFACVGIHGAKAAPVLRRCKIFGGASSGVVVYDKATATIENCEITGHATHGVICTSGSTPQLTGCEIHNNRKAGLLVDDDGRAVLDGCRIYRNALYGVAVLTGGNPTLQTCAIYGNRPAGVFVGEKGRGTFRECTIRDNGRDQLNIKPGADVDFQDCKVVGEEIPTKPGKQPTQGEKPKPTGKPEPAEKPKPSGPDATPKEPKAGADATPSETIVVSRDAADQDARFFTIGDALQHAAPGARIVVKPGVYREAVVLDRDVEIVGAADPKQVVIETADADCVSMQTDRAALRRLTLRCRAGEKAGHYAVDASRGDLVLEDCYITSDSLACVGIHGSDSAPVLRRCAIEGGNQSGVAFYDKAGGTLESCTIRNNTTHGVSIAAEADPTIRNCTIADNKRIGLVVDDAGKGTIEDCDIRENEHWGVAIATAGNPSLRKCRIHRNKRSGVFVGAGGLGTLQDCAISDNRHAGLAVAAAGNPILRGCDIHDNQRAGASGRTGAQGSLEHCFLHHNGGEQVAREENSHLIVSQCNLGPEPQPRPAALVDAVRAGNLQAARDALEEGADVDYRFRPGPGGSILLMAAQNGNADLVRLLLEFGATVDAADRGGLTPLMAAARSGHLPVVQSLLASGADVNAAHRDGSTALMQAAYFGHRDVVDTLLERGASVDAANRYGLTPLMAAAIGDDGRDQIMQALIDRGADVDALHQHGESILVMALLWRRPKNAVWLVDHGAEPNLADATGRSPLILAAMTGQKPVVEALLAVGADPLARDDHGATAAQWADRNGHAEVAKLLARAEQQARLAPTQPLPGLKEDGAGAASLFPAFDSLPQGISEAWSTFLDAPSRDNYLALCGVASPSRSDQVDLLLVRERLDQKHYGAAGLALNERVPAWLPSCRAHRYAAQVARGMSQPLFARRENQYAQVCLQAILATGDGSPQQPFYVVCTADEFDVAKDLKKTPVAHARRNHNGKTYDVIECHDGSELWFDAPGTMAALKD